MHFNRPPLLATGPLTELEQHNEFIYRHIGPTDDDIDSMLQILGESQLDSMVINTLPPAILNDEQLNLPAARGEAETIKRLRHMSTRNILMHNMIGLGYHDTITPPVIQRNVLENPGWYTAYTPYQAEISQGRLEGLLNFQHMICDLTGMELANASLLDEATAGAEAMAQARRINRKNKSNRFLLDGGCLPQSIDVISNRAEHFGFEVVTGDPAVLVDDGEYFGMLLQYPGCNGEITDWQQTLNTARGKNIIVIMAADLLSLVLLKPPGELGADITVGNSQRFGVPLGYGGPHAAFYATLEAHKRTMPGRIIGVSVDRRGLPALRMALQTREQHIRRDKATSNICTAQSLLAVMSGFYAVYHGATGLKRIAGRVHRLTSLLRKGLEQLDITTQNKNWFDTLCIELPEAECVAVMQKTHAAGINLYRTGPTGIAISVNEKTGRQHILDVLAAFGHVLDHAGLAAMDQEMGQNTSGIPKILERSSGFLEHPVFSRYHSETEMLRYLKRLENKDISLVHSMISLGSCTMKLNAATEMMPITWPEFSDIHPFAPLDQAQGYQQLFRELEEMLIACTGYDAVSLQPNAGSQGEYAGLLVIKAYHKSRNQAQRDICLIPSSAHGTNPASAAMAGMKIVVVRCDNYGNVDVNDLKQKAEQHADKLAALMITYPSTHGVYEEQIVEICELVHRYGGQVYLDGANLSALMGYASPGKFGADVSHLNLHKTFCIPHGGGGPGVGPICVGAHLKEFLPGHSVQPVNKRLQQVRAVAAAPWGSAGILPISWAFIAMMGRDGIKKATQVAILNANYIAHHLDEHYKVLYTGRNNRVAHECIIDLRPFKASAGITEEDVAKRLIDFGFHSPTMSFPVPGTLMIEPTESESRQELDRFIDAMITIRQEIERVANGSWDRADNPLVNSPHTAVDLVAEDWNHGYSREQAVYPLSALRENKFWAPVNRIDNVYGDRNLVCSHPPIDSCTE